jgi:hypothetical protein
VGVCVGCCGGGDGYGVWGVDSVYCFDGSGRGGGAVARGSWFCGRWLRVWRVGGCGLSGLVVGIVRVFLWDRSRLRRSILRMGGGGRRRWRVWGVCGLRRR